MSSILSAERQMLKLFDNSNDKKNVSENIPIPPPGQLHFFSIFINSFGSEFFFFFWLWANQLIYGRRENEKLVTQLGTRFGSDG